MKWGFTPVMPLESSVTSHNIISNYFLYCASHPKGVPKHCTLLPLVTGMGLKAFLKPSKLPGEYTACAPFNHKNHLCPHRYPFTPEQSVLLRDTSVKTGIWTHTLLNRSTLGRVRCSYPLGHDTPRCFTIRFTTVKPPVMLLKCITSEIDRMSSKAQLFIAEY